MPLTLSKISGDSQSVRFQRKQLFILRSFTVEPIVPLLVADCLTLGIELEIPLGDFNAFVQEIIDPQSSLYETHPNLVLLATQTRDVSPLL